MAASKNDIRQWLEKAKNDFGATHMLVVCDTFDHDDYPVVVFKDEDVRLVAAKYNGHNMQQLMEVYHLGMDFDLQLAQGKAMNYDLPDLKEIEKDPQHHPPTEGELSEFRSSGRESLQREILWKLHRNEINVSEALAALNKLE